MSAIPPPPRRQYLDKLCRVCDRTHREHADDEYDTDGDCTASPRRVLEPAALVTTLERLRLMRHARMMEAKKPAEPGDSLVPFLTASLDCTALDNCIRLLERELKAVAS